MITIAFFSNNRFVFFLFLLSFSFFFLFFSFHIFIHCHPLLSYGPNFKSLAHREVSLKSITKFLPDRHARKRVNKNMVIKMLIMMKDDAFKTHNAENWIKIYSFFSMLFVKLEETKSPHNYTVKKKLRIWLLYSLNQLKCVLIENEPFKRS